MQVFEGVSDIESAEEAIQSIIQSWDLDDFSVIDMVFVFHSTKQQAEGVADCLQKVFPKAQIAGCTTAGELCTEGHSNGSLVLCAIHSPKVRWKVGVIETLDQLTVDDCRGVLDGMTEALDITRADLDPSKHFCILFPDGMSAQEERLASELSLVLEGVPMIGGSAGDDLAFKQTWSIANDRAYSNATTLILGESEVPFKVIKHQHFIEESADLVATDVDSAKRIIHTFDGYPAAERYAEVLGLTVDKLDADVFSQHPITFAVNGEIYVRSIQQIGEDNSLCFYCGVEEGMVFHLGGHNDMVQSLEEDFGCGDSGKFDLLIACNCILRSLEASAKDQLDPLSAALEKVSDHVVGFDTYGEQLNGLHINQTLVGLGFCKVA